MEHLIDDIITRGYLRTEKVIDAFRQIKREDFVKEDFLAAAEEDIALPIGFGQTISQPLTVAFMLELLDLQSGQKVLDVGSGSGWTTALIAHLVGPQGKVIGLEIIEELVAFGKYNTAKYDFIQKGIAKFHLADGSKGFLQEAPYDRILVSAAATCIPNELKEQLKVGGKIIIPVGDSIWQMEKRGRNEFQKKEYEGFVFVPLVEK